MFSYNINENNEVLILSDGNDHTYQTRYPDGTEWTYEQAEEWALLKIAYLQDPENTPDAPSSPLT